MVISQPAKYPKIIYLQHEHAITAHPESSPPSIHHRSSSIAPSIRNVESIGVVPCWQAKHLLVIGKNTCKPCIMHTSLERLPRSRVSHDNINARVSPLNCKGLRIDRLLAPSTMTQTSLREHDQDEGRQLCMLFKTAKKKNACNFKKRTKIRPKAHSLRVNWTQIFLLI